MDGKRILLIGMSCLAGGGIGFWLRGPGDESISGTTAEPSVLAAIVESTRCDDSVEDLLKAKGSELNEKLPLWLLSASSDEIRKLWSAWNERALPEPWQANLIFARWLELDPTAAKRAAGSDPLGHLTWVRAMSEPESVVAEIGKLPDRNMMAAMLALCEFHPDMALKVLEMRPEIATPVVVRRLERHRLRGRELSSLDAVQIPQAGNERRDLTPEWILEDTQAAFEWIKAKPADGAEDPALELFVEVLADKKPASLKSLAEAQPHGRIRRTMERALFYHCLNSKQDEALSMARRMESPRVAAEWLAAIGNLHFVGESEKAFALFDEMLNVCPDALRLPDRVANPRGFGTEFFVIPGVEKFAGALLKIDAERTLAIALAVDAKRTNKMGSSWNGSIASLADIWSEQDLEGFRTWLENHPPGAVRDGGAGLLAWTYAHRGEFPKALGWARSIANEQDSQSRIREVARGWARGDRESLEKWLETSEITDPVRRIINYELEDSKR